MVSQSPKKTPGIQSLLVIHQGALGDFILALPALETLRKAFPQAKLTIMGYPRILELVERRYYAEEILSIDQKGMATFFVQEGNLDFALSQFFKTFDLLIVFGKDGEGPVIKNLRRVCTGQFLHINSFPPWDEEIHLTDYLLEQFSQHGFPASGLSPKLHLKESDREWARNFLKNRGVDIQDRSRMIVLHPGSGSKKKVWPLERFLNLARILQDRSGSKLLIIFGPAEGPEVQKAFEKMGSAEFILTKSLTLLQLASVMEGAWFFIGNDSGISHLAAAMGLPTVVIFGPTDQRVWSPRGEKTFVVRRGIPCSPCPQERFFQCKDFECLRGIDIGEVLEGIEKIGIEFKS